MGATIRVMAYAGGGCMSGLLLVDVVVVAVVAATVVALGRT